MTYILWVSQGCGLQLICEALIRDNKTTHFMQLSQSLRTWRTIAEESNNMSREKDLFFSLNIITHMRHHNPADRLK